MLAWIKGYMCAFFSFAGLCSCVLGIWFDRLEAVSFQVVVLIVGVDLIYGWPVYIGQLIWFTNQILWVMR